MMMMMKIMAVVMVLGVRWERVKLFGMTLVGVQVLRVPGREKKDIDSSLLSS